MISTIYDIDKEYEILDTKTNFEYLLLRNKNLIFKRDIKTVNILTKIVLGEKGNRKYLKILLLWFSVLIMPIYKFSRVVFMENSDLKILFIGKSDRIKVIKEKVIVNRRNKDKFSNRDFYIRKKINGLNISPTILEYKKNYYTEELIIDFKHPRNNSVAYHELVKFKNHFKMIIMPVDKYILKLLNIIKGYDSYIYHNLIELNIDSNGSIEIQMSHGDLIDKNILVSKHQHYLIDFEFSAYRSNKYDLIYEYYYKDRRSFLLQECDIVIYIFILERLILILKIEKELGIAYRNEIDSLLVYLKGELNC